MICYLEVGRLQWKTITSISTSINNNNKNNALETDIEIGVLRISGSERKTATEGRRKSD